MRRAATLILGILFCILVCHCFAEHLGVDSHIRSCFPSYTRSVVLQEPFRHYQVYDGQRALLGVCFFAQDIIKDVSGYSGPLSVFIGMTLHGEISGVFILDSQDAPEYAQKAFSHEFLSQFKNKKSTDLFSIGDDVQAVSGATISSSAVIRIVKEAALSAYERLFTHVSKISPSRVSEPVTSSLTGRPLQGLQHGPMDFTRGGSSEQGISRAPADQDPAVKKKA